MLSITGLGWQSAFAQPLRGANEQVGDLQLMQFRLPQALGKMSGEQNSQGSTSQQQAEDNRQEAFAKLMVMLQNPDVAARQAAGTSTSKVSEGSATEAFRDFMDKTPAEMIKEKLLAEMGLTEEEYNALPPEQRAAIDEQIAQRMKDEIEAKTQAKVAQAQVTAEASRSSGVSDPVQAQQEKEKLETMGV